MADENLVTFADLELGETKEDTMPFNLKSVRETAETQAIKRALAFSHNNISSAAKLLGVTRPTLYTLFEKYGIKVND